MSHNIIKYKIKIIENQFNIKLYDKIHNLNIENLLDLYCLILSLNINEKKNGNEYESAQIKLKYIQNMLIIEHINIFKIIRTPSLFDFIKYFQTFENKFSTQNTETKLNINDYFENIENISQEIIIKMVFIIQTDILEINKTKNSLKTSFKGVDLHIYNLK